MNSDIYFYFHIPFCYRKCQYCSFVSYEKRLGYLDRYVDALIEEIDSFYTDKTVKTIYFGGGTPSVLKPKHIERILNRVHKEFSCKIEEMTFEIIPLVRLEYLKALKCMGINRLSIGVQSFLDNKLRLLGRIHKKEDSLRVIDDALSAGFENISIDLIYGVNETMDELLNDLAITCRLDIHHVSAYMLSVDKGSEFYRMGFRPSPDEDVEAFYLKLCEVLTGCGLEQYEISNFAKRGFESRHNSAYWLGYDYRGFGVSASSFVSNMRTKNTNNLIEYLENPKGSWVVEERLSEIELAREMFVLALRLKKGVELESFRHRYGVDVMDLFGERIRYFLELGLLKKDGGRLFLASPKAMLVSNAIFSEFI
ncbi:radical SAM family heme chaperone HemW [Hippea sp. KM1]|uniref:radical SAM family heme chaperone HemW n=1 Tax=Hippea sp. KM1 TaxID=944481 RepID=UPI00046D358A|nr:radical SAM family heme chaperone HemW [Hippea sp. KM1]